MSWMGVRGCRSLKRIFGIVWKGLDARIGQGCILGLAYIRWSDPPRWPEPRHSWPNPHPGTSTTIMVRRMTCMVGSLLDFWEIKHVSPNTCFCLTPRPDSACDICVFSERHMAGLLRNPSQWYYTTIESLTWWVTWRSDHLGSFTISDQSWTLLILIARCLDGISAAAYKWTV